MKRSKELLFAAALLIISGCSNSVPDQSASAEQSGYSETPPVSQALEQPQNSSAAEDAAFTGLGKQGFDTGNLTINTKPGFHSEFFCAADGEVFFTNFGDREYLYKITEGGTELVVEKPACCINYFDNKLYFLSSDSISADNIDFTGTMYCYDLQSGDCQMLCNEKVGSLTVGKDGIYYSALKAGEGAVNTYEIRLMNFDGSSQKCFYDPMFRYGDYLIMPNGIVDLTKEENIAQPSYEDIIPFSADFTNYVGACVYGEFLFCLGTDKSLLLYNLCDGTTSSVQKEKISELYGGALLSVSDYILCGGTLYLAHSADMLTAVDLETMQMAGIQVDNCRGKIVEQLYTDGAEIYALLRNTSHSEPELVHMIDNGDQLTAEKLG